MPLFPKKKYYEATFSANTPNDAPNIEKELVALIALDLAIGKSVKEKRIKEFKPNMVCLPENHYGIDGLSQQENDALVEQAKNLMNNVSNGISVDAGLYSLSIRREGLDISSDYRIKITANGKTDVSEEEAEAHSMCLSKKLERYSKIKLIKNTLSDYWNV